MCPCTWFGVFGPNFPKVPQYPSTCETGIAWPIEGPDTRVRSNLMWNKELKTLDYFSCVLAHDLGYSGPVSPNCPNTWVPVKQVYIIQPTEGLDTSIRSHLMQNKELWRLWISFCDFVHTCWFRGIWALFPQIALIPNLGPVTWCPNTQSQL